MIAAIFWFRNDLRIEDNPALTEACQQSDVLVPIYIHEKKFDLKTQWGHSRLGDHRRLFLHQSLQALRKKVQALESELLEFSGDYVEVFSRLRIQLGIGRIYCEQIEAPEELGQIRVLQDMGFEVICLWQSSMLEPANLPFDLKQLPDIFTNFRQAIERKNLRFASPEKEVSTFPPLPARSILDGLEDIRTATVIDRTHSQFNGGIDEAKDHVRQYFERRLVDSYKQTRNGLMGMDFSSKFSPWLASGSLSVRSVAQKLQDYENQYGANEGTYWLWFELLWRDYFRFLHFKYGERLYHSRGLSNSNSHPFNQVEYLRWTSGKTGEPLVDAGMRELNETGFLSNRMRQIVASYWIYDLHGDWQAGAAWFEYQLIDYDVYSNQGNWLYIAGKGTDPRGGRHFNIKKQAKDYDPEGSYQRQWLTGRTMSMP